jgi:ATP-dependent Lon protease
MPTKDPDQTPQLTPTDIPQTLPLLPLRDVVIFPHMIFPVLVGRESSLRAVTAAIELDKLIMVCAQRDPNDDNPTWESIHHQGTVARILQVLKLPNGLMKVLVDGLFQAKLHAIETDAAQVLRGRIEVVSHVARATTHLKALVRQLDGQFAEYVKMHRNIPNESLISYEGLNEPERKMFFVAANMLVNVETRQSVLALDKLEQQLYALVRILSNELAIMRVEAEIDDKVHANIQQSQRRYYIQEQIRILQDELGEGEESLAGDLDQLEERIAASGMNDEARAKAGDELAKLRRMSPMSPEATVSRNYIDWLLAMPWTTYSADNLDIRHAQQILDADHHGLEKPKERILEHIAVLNLVGQMKGQILCLVGPPGVGKTSLGRSIARALGRRFVRLSLGGVHDEAEIRGHRRTYIGSMPGKIVQALKKAGTANPVILLDEIDKMSNDFHGDPSSAMLEVLDPEQNSTFNDHYLDIDYDLSKVMFITTANVRWSIPLPLQDRMEIIELPGYLEHEKLAIARRHLVKKQVEMHGMKRFKVAFDDAALLRIVREYTQEAGVRSLEREIASICRKLARRALTAPDKADFRVRTEAVESLLGVPKLKPKRIPAVAQPGSVIGLAWTSVGGDILQVDVTIMPGAEKLTLTGQLGDVMKESAQAALSWLRVHAEQLGVPADFPEKKEIHIHLPEGAIPKDGPSAGITLAIALLSAVTGRAVRTDLAMTGEITLHGEVLPIGGLNEKLLAARRYNVKTVLIPQDNAVDLTEISKRITSGLQIVPVATINDALPHVFADSRRKPSRARTKTSTPATDGGASSPTVH